MNVNTMNHVNCCIYQASKHSDEPSGDAYYMHETEDYFICAVVDGLGSGEFAQHSAQLVTSVIEKQQHEGVETIMIHCNAALKKERGAAVAVVKVTFATQEMQFCSVGNVQFYMYQQHEPLKYPIPQAGFLSGKPQQYKVETFNYDKTSRFMMYSDGITVHSPRKLLEQQSDVKLICSDLVALVTNRDDVTIVVGEIIY